MSETEKSINRLIISGFFSFFTYLLITNYIVEMPFLKYFLIEIVLVISLKIFTFTVQKTKLQ